MKVTAKSNGEIAELAWAIALQYFDSTGGNVAFEEPDEFISAIELDLRSTLRDELAKMATTREVEETPTVGFSSSGDADSEKLDLTLDSEFENLGATLDSVL